MSTPGNRSAGPRSRHARAAEATASLRVASMLSSARRRSTPFDPAPLDPALLDPAVAPTPGVSGPGSAGAPARAPSGASAPGFTSGTVSEAVPVSHGGRTYRVRTDDTVVSVAAAHGVSARAIVELNGLRGNPTLRAGQILSLPERSVTPRPAGHRVAAGQTLAAIAREHGTSVAALQRANAMGDSVLIRVGEVLALTGSGASSSRAQLPLPDDLPRLPADVDGRPYPESVHLAARINKHTLAGMPVPGPAEVRRMIPEVAESVGVEPALLIALAQHESGFQQRLVSPGNAIGVMQVVPRAGEWAASLAGAPLDLFDARDNITAGAAILRWLLARADTEAEALAGYAQGLASVRERGALPEVRRLVRNIQVTRERFI